MIFEPFPTCYWGYPVYELKLTGEKGFEEWWEGDNGWWYIVMNKHEMSALTYCLPYWGA